MTLELWVTVAVGVLGASAQIVASLIGRQRSRTKRGRLSVRRALARNRPLKMPQGHKCQEPSFHPPCGSRWPVA